jgi:hypothetical protein
VLNASTTDTDASPNARVPAATPVVRRGFDLGLITISVC